MKDYEFVKITSKPNKRQVVFHLFKHDLEIANVIVYPDLDSDLLSKEDVNDAMKILEDFYE